MLVVLLSADGFQGSAGMEVLRDGLKVTEAAERYRVSRQRVHAWLGRYATAGLDGLADRSHRPGVAHIRCRPPSRPAWVSGAATIPAGVSAAWPTNSPAMASTHRPDCRAATGPWSATASSSPRPGGDPRPATDAGNGPGRCSCGSWTSWVGSGWPTAANSRP